MFKLIDYLMIIKSSDNLMRIGRTTWVFTVNHFSFVLKFPSKIYCSIVSPGRASGEEYGMNDEEELSVSGVDIIPFLTPVCPFLSQLSNS